MFLKKIYNFDIKIFYVFKNSNQRVVYTPLQNYLFLVKVVCKKTKYSNLTKFDYLNPSQAKIEHILSNCNLASSNLNCFIKHSSSSSFTLIFGFEQQVAAHTIFLVKKITYLYYKKVHLLIVGGCLN